MLSTTPGYQESQLVSLINAYVRSRISGVARTERSHASLLDAYQARLAVWRKSQETSASDFNLLATLKIVGDEVRHSIMLEWLLDHRIERAGTHAQGNLGFRLFLEETQLDKKGYADTDYLVAREVKGAVSRVDVEVAASRSFIIHLENKIYSKEAMDVLGNDDQTKREWADLQRRAHHLAVPPENIHAFFVTLTGDKPSSHHFAPLPWHRIADVADKFADKAKAPEVSLFARHYARALRWMTQRIAPHEDAQTHDSP